MSSKEFEDISIPKWKLSNQAVDKKIYRVYSSATEFQVVEAESATEAAVKSGLAKVIMIKHGERDELTMIDKSMLFADMPAVEAPVEAPATEAPQA